MAHQPPAQSQVEINHANFYTPCAYSNNFSKGVDLDLMTVQGYMKDTPRHYRHVHCTACWTHPVKPWASNARYNYTKMGTPESGEVWESNPRLLQFIDIATDHCTTCVVILIYILIITRVFFKSKSKLFVTHLTILGYLYSFCF